MRRGSRRLVPVVVTCGIASLITALVTVLGACTSSTPAHAPPEPEVALPRERVAPSVERTRPDDRPPPPTLEELVAGGTHWRLATASGPIHVWVPRGYNPKKADTIVYVHGFYVNADQAWKGYDLATQFAASALNAMFIVPEAPSGGHERVFWPELQPLLETVHARITQPMPRRRIVAVGHSGAWRTLVSWLGDPAGATAIDTVVLVDAVYGELDKYKAWILGDERRRLINVGDGTRPWTDKLHRDLPQTVVIDGFPSVDEGIPKRAARARILYIKSSLGHFPLVTSGFALPMILRTLRARRLVRTPLAELLDG